MLLECKCKVTHLVASIVVQCNSANKDDIYIIRMTEADSMFFMLGQMMSFVASELIFCRGFLFGSLLHIFIYGTCSTIWLNVREISLHDILIWC